MKTPLFPLWPGLTRGQTVKKLFLILLGAMICSFGIHNIHQRTSIAEGGVIGLMLFFEHWFHFSPAYITPVLDILCYLLAFKFLGGSFIKTSAVCTVCISLCYKLWEALPPMLPDLSGQPLAAAVCGAVFVGVGTGLLVRQGGSFGGDDALSLTIQHLTHWRLARCYLVTDLTVLALSLSYIPFSKIVYSLITVTLSSALVDLVANFRRPPASAPADHGN